MPDLIDKIAFPKRLRLSSPSTADELSVSAEWVFDPTTSRYRGTAVNFASPTVAVRSTSIKATPVRDTLVPAARQHLAQGSKANLALAATVPPIKTYFQGATAARAASAAVRRPSLTQLQQAAAVHALARSIGDFPVLAVARSFGLTQRQAASWVGRARRRGMLIA